MIEQITKPYEILLRAQEDGSWAGHYQEIKSIVDTSTGQPIAPDQIGLAQPLDAVADLPAVIAGINAANVDALVARSAELAELQNTVSLRDATIASLTSQVAALQQEIAALTAGGG